MAVFGARVQPKLPAREHGLRAKKYVQLKNMKGALGNAGRPGEGLKFP